MDSDDVGPDTKADVAGSIFTGDGAEAAVASWYQQRLAAQWPEWLLLGVEPAGDPTPTAPRGRTRLPLPERPAGGAWANRSASTGSVSAQNTSPAGVFAFPGIPLSMVGVCSSGKASAAEAEGGIGADNGSGNAMRDDNDCGNGRETLAAFQREARDGRAIHSQVQQHSTYAPQQIIHHRPASIGVIRERVASDGTTTACSPVRTRPHSDSAILLRAKPGQLLPCYGETSQPAVSQPSRFPAGMDRHAWHGPPCMDYAISGMDTTHGGLLCARSQLAPIMLPPATDGLHGLLGAAIQAWKQQQPATLSTATAQQLTPAATGLVMGRPLAGRETGPAAAGLVQIRKQQMLDMFEQSLSVRVRSTGLAHLHMVSLLLLRPHSMPNHVLT